MQFYRLCCAYISPIKDFLKYYFLYYNIKYFLMPQYVTFYIKTLSITVKGIEEVFDLWRIIFH